ncbi:hypothetical protein [Flavobacterium psychrolimnae]|uniref:Lipoprotein n=1 Tax=Flavobacterium psychrolimnae TaxID=249351 RepID=A0A366B3Y2_9FLAO|nr:hypothetical protein [Flavobacterium psychrolimnae]RBN50914.1 hypothetical protein DR980_06165 [Flavobacterium psychrolimnae]
MKNIITLLISVLFLVSCGNSKTENENDSNKNIIDVKTIIGKTESEIEKILGKSENSEQVSPSNTPCKDIPCEKKFYQKNKFEIVFIDGKSDWITINNISNFDFNSENITLLGLSSTVPNFENTISIKWNDIENINDVTFFNNGENKIEYIYIKAYTK